MKKIILLLVMGIALAGTASAELMPDGGFEAGMWSGSGGFIYMAYPSNYSWGYASAYQGSVSPHAGAKFGAFPLPASGAAYSWSYAAIGWQSFAGGSGWSAAWQQGLAVSAGDVVQASAYIKELNGVVGAAGILKIEWIDGTGNEISEVIESFVATSSWALITGSSFTAPAGTASVTMVVGHETANGGIVGATIGFDNVSLTPEPVTIALLGLGGLLIRRRRA